MLRYRLGALVAAGVLALGLAGPGHAAPPSASTDTVHITGQWGIYGLYSSQWACQDKGEWLVNVMEYYSNFYCSRPGSQWELWVYSP